MMFQAPLGHEIAFYAFAIASLIGLLRILKKPETFPSYPALAALVWVMYILPQAFGILYNPRWLPLEVYLEGFVPTMVMCLLCVIAGAVGWSAYSPQELHRRQRLSAQEKTQLDVEKLFLLGGVFSAISIASFIYVASLSGGIMSYYSVTGAYELDWMGIEVLLAFAQKIFGNLGLIALAFAFFRKPNLLHGAVMAFAMLPNIGDIIFLNRRSDFIYTGLALATSLYFARHWRPSRSLVMAGAIASAAVVFVFPVIRGTYLIGADDLKDPRAAEERGIMEVISQDVLGGEGQKEFNNSIGMVASYDKTGRFGYGAQTWNHWVRTSIPRTFFGDTIKSSLMMPSGKVETVTNDAYGWEPVWYMSRSLAANLFVEFWYLGAIAFFVMGRVFRIMFEKAKSGDQLAQLSYIAYSLLVPHWIATGFEKLPRDVLATMMLMVVIQQVASMQMPRWAMMHQQARA